MVDYMDYMDVLLHGTEDEKLHQSFALLDIKNRNKVNYKSFLEVAQNVSRMWAAAYGKSGIFVFQNHSNYHIVEMDEEVIKKVFETISSKKKSFKAQDYVKIVKKHPDLMTWLSKPKELLDGKLEKNINSKEH